MGFPPAMDAFASSFLPLLPHCSLSSVFPSPFHPDVVGFCFACCSPMFLLTHVSSVFLSSLWRDAPDSKGDTMYFVIKYENEDAAAAAQALDQTDFNGVKLAVEAKRIPPP